MHAAHLKLDRHGLLRAGYFADVVVFDSTEHPSCGKANIRTLGRGASYSARRAATNRLSHRCRLIQRSQPC